MAAYALNLANYAPSHSEGGHGSPKRAEKVVAVLAEKLENVEFDMVVGPAMGGIVVAYELARQVEKPGIFSERVDGQMTFKRGFEIKNGQKVIKEWKVRK